MFGSSLGQTKRAEASRVVARHFPTVAFFVFAPDRQPPVRSLSHGAASVLAVLDQEPFPRELHLGGSDRVFRNEHVEVRLGQLGIGGLPASGLT
jgi:hypothetical protein